MTTQANVETGNMSAYRDKRRGFWLLSMLFPLLPLGSAACYWVTGSELALWLPFLSIYTVVPLLDKLLGEDTSNPPEALAAQLEADRYYRCMTHFAVPLYGLALVFSAWFVASQNLSPGGFLAMALTMGWASTLGLNIGHELGHKQTRLERWLAKFCLAGSGYGHFTIEHNKGHHRQVATPEDIASARMGENVYQFMLREVPGGLCRAWALERDRLLGRGKPVWSLDNEILQTMTITVVLYAALSIGFGAIVMPFLLLQAGFTWFKLTNANYLEHYGLLRRKDEQGRYERPQPKHSWNSNHVFSNVVLFNIERHSDHHAHASRRYQALRHHDEAPQLPNGYMGMFIVVLIPPLWRRVMDGRLLAWADYDMDRINVAPGKREKLLAKYEPLLRSAKASIPG